MDILDDADLCIIDCRFSLDDPMSGYKEWLQSRIPGASYAHLDLDLSAPIGDGSFGRHPLPGKGHVHDLMDHWDIDADTLVVAYDNAGGAFASRLWWMLRWAGHEGACVLNGGWNAWTAAGGPVDDAAPDEEPSWAELAARQAHVGDSEEASRPEPMPLKIGREELSWLAGADELLEMDAPLVDARADVRYRGETEPIDPVAGHIPGAVNMPWMSNLGPDGRFLPAAELAARWEALGGSEGAVCYCGSGVTACHAILSAAAAGLPLPRLYAPSWSGWISDASRPVE